MRKHERHDSKMRMKRRPFNRQRPLSRFQLPKDAQVDYKNLILLQKFLTDRGKVLSRRLSGITAKEQRQLTMAIKRARFLALLPSGGVKK